MKTKPTVNVLVPEGMTRRDLLKLLGMAGVAGGLPLVSAPPASAGGTLNYFTWSAWGEGPFVTDAKKLGIDLKTTFYSSSDEMVAKLRGGGTKLYDMIVPVQHYVKLLADNDLVEPMDRSKMTNANDLFPEFVGTHHWEFGGKFYGMPFVWGANAMAYNRKVMGDVDTLNVLFDPKWKGRIAMRDEPEDSIGVGALKLGIKKPFEMDEKALQEVKKLLISQKPLLRAYWKNVADVQNMLASGEVAVAWTFLAVIAPLRKAGVDAGWVWPKEGALGWNEAITAVRGTRNKALVEEYANHTLSADYGEMMAKETRYATTSKVAVGRLDPKLVADLGIDTKNINRLVFKEIPPNKARWNEIWNEVKNA
jgi:spermidine/putrescine transport system substrate-binding protein